MIGLISAAESWEPGRGLRFSTYAFPKIRGAISTSCAAPTSCRAAGARRCASSERTVAELEQRSGMAPLPEEIAEAMGIALEEVDAILLSAKSAGTASLETVRASSSWAC